MKSFAGILLLLLFSHNIIAQTESSPVVVSFGKISASGEMSPQEIAAVQELTVSPADEWEMISCQITVLKKGVMYSFRLSSAVISEEARKFTADMQKGDKLFVDQIQLRNKNNRQTQRLPAIVVKVN